MSTLKNVSKVVPKKTVDVEKYVYKKDDSLAKKFKFILYYVITLLLNNICTHLLFGTTY